MGLFRNSSPIIVILPAVQECIQYAHALSINWKYGHSFPIFSACFKNEINPYICITINTILLLCLKFPASLYDLT